MKSLDKKLIFIIKNFNKLKDYLNLESLTKISN
jgi:hypothetical protein